MNNTKFLQALFNGFQTTPSLWDSSEVYNFEQFNLEPTTAQFTQQSEYKRLRLGKWVEKFVAFQLQQQDDIINSSRKYSC